MPTATYEQLLAETLPARIDNDEQYEHTGARLGNLIGRGRARTSEETRLMELLVLLVEDYDRRNAMPPMESAPYETLRFLLEYSGKDPSELLPVFGQRSHVNEALHGKRPISAIQARKLGKLFRVKPGLFV